MTLATYINQLADPTAWNRMIDYPSDMVSVLVANVLNRPDMTVNEDWVKVINRSQQRLEISLGSINLADWVSQIQTDVDLWYSLYPGKIGGIFFVEWWNDCGPDNQ
ncbi:hypothetical protein BDV11DRAFT_175809 [Aspergillus similis]